MQLPFFVKIVLRRDMANKSSLDQLSIFDITPTTDSEVAAKTFLDAEGQVYEGYSPSHPWYYKLGGRVLDVDEIRPTESHNFDPIDRTKSGKPRPALEIQLESARQQLEKDIARYKQLITEGDKACSSYDLMMGYDAKFMLWLAHNHVAYSKGRVIRLEEANRRFGL